MNGLGIERFRCVMARTGGVHHRGRRRGGGGKTRNAPDVKGMENTPKRKATDRKWSTKPHPSPTSSPQVEEAQRLHLLCTLRGSRLAPHAPGWSRFVMVFGSSTSRRAYRRPYAPASGDTRQGRGPDPNKFPLTHPCRSIRNTCPATDMHMSTGVFAAFRATLENI